MAFVSTTHRSRQLFFNVSFLLVLSFYITTHLFSFPSDPLPIKTPHLTNLQQGCQSIEGLNLKDYKAKCSYIKTHNPCSPRGFIDYLNIFYCICGKYPLLGYSLLALWLLVLFYLLGNTASQYFCSSLEGLSRALRLPPTVAGVTLLALGNGAPDVFASIVSFASSGTSEVGLSSVLGGGFFVTTVVVGVISVSIVPHSVCIDWGSFVRDLCFLLSVLCLLLVIMVVGSINMLGSICLACLYIVYVALVSVGYCCKINGELEVPLLDSIEVEEPASMAKEVIEGDGLEIDQLGYLTSNSSDSSCFSWFLYVVEMPLYLPRRLTIPDVTEERWSQPFAVASVTLSPLLLATLWNSGTGEMGTDEGLTIYMVSGFVGIVMGIIAWETTEKSRPPKRCQFPWLAGGFLMSVVWTYITARELVALLVSIGHILSISPTVLGLTVLAWGNSLGDLTANLVMAVGGGQEGAQIAISGCYAGPIFNTLVGLGLSLMFSSWSAYPSPVVIPHDPSLYETVGFLMAGLIWALVILPRRGMKLDRVLGVGLLAIYLCFLCLRLSESIIISVVF